MKEGDWVYVKTDAQWGVASVIRVLNITSYALLIFWDMPNEEYYWPIGSLEKV